MSIKPFYLIGTAVVVLSATAAVTVFAADTAPKAAPAKDAPKAERHVVRMVTPTFVDIDTNHDGAISPAEFDAYRDAHKGNLREEAPGMMPGMGPRGMQPPMFVRHFERRDEGFGGMHGERALDLLDTNNDGKLSFDELIAPMKRHFARQDVNHDGVLSADEMEKGHDRLERRLPPPPEAQ